MKARTPKLRSRLPVWALAVLCAGVAGPAAASSVTIELSNGYVYALDVRAVGATPGVPAHPYVAFSGLGYVLRQFDRESQWDWDARAGLLRVAVGDERFSLPSARAVVAINERRVPVSRPVRFSGGEIWIPVETCRLVVGSIEGLQIQEPAETISPGAAPTTASIVGSPDDALRGGLLTGQSGTDFPASAPLLAIPPPDVRVTWRVVLDPVLIDRQVETGGERASVRVSLAQIAERCASLLRDEGSMQPRLLTEHADATTPDLVLEWLAREPADLVVFLRLEVSPLCTDPGYMVLYAEESVDSLGLAGASQDPTGAMTAVPLARRYLPFQAGNRRLAEMIGAALDVDGLPEFRQRRVVPAPLYLLKRCSSRSAMVVFTFPERSPVLARLADSDFRETVASALAGALIALSRGYRGSAAARENGSREPFSP